MKERQILVWFWVVRSIIMVLFVLLLPPIGRWTTKSGCHAWKASSFSGHKWQLRYQTSKRSYVRPTQCYMMPEGPEVRTLVDQVQQGGVIGRRLVDIQFLSGRYVRHGRPKGFESFAQTMTPIFQPHTAIVSSSVDTIREWNAKGKFIYIVLDDGSNPPLDTNATDFQRSIWITLGMSGRFVNEKSHRQDPRFARWRLELLDVSTNDMWKLYYHDQRNFGTLRFSLSRQELQDKLDSLGPDILDPEMTTEQDFLSIMNRQRPELNICKFLMDQSKLSGIGNYILSECLYRAKIDPFASLQELNEDQRRYLFREAQAVALESYHSQGLTRKGGSFRSVDGDPGGFEFQLQCYSREICAQGDLVRKESDGPHSRAIWYTDKQLFMPLQERMKQQQQQQQQQQIIVNQDSNDSISELSSDKSKSKKTSNTTTPIDTLPVDTEKSVTTTVASAAAKNNDDGSIVTSYETIDLVHELHDDSWRNVLTDAIQSESFQNLQSFLRSEYATGATIYPPPHDIFAALNTCPFDKVKVVIVGQDPYHGPGQGHGMAFSVRKGIKAPPSLQNIVREAMEDVSIPIPQHGNLEHWAQQGVLLLNTVLTVRRGEANSHKGKGWETFTDSIIQVLNDRNDTGIVFLLWGSPAAKKAASVDESKHVVIRTSHPSPLGATKTASPFLGSRCFSKTNDALKSKGHSPIDWTIL